MAKVPQKLVVVVASIVFVSCDAGPMRDMRPVLVVGEDLVEVAISGCGDGEGLASGSAIQFRLGTRRQITSRNAAVLFSSTPNSDGAVVLSPAQLSEIEEAAEAESILQLEYDLVVGDQTLKWDSEFPAEAFVGAIAAGPGQILVERASVETAPKDVCRVIG